MVNLQYWQVLRVVHDLPLRGLFRALRGQRLTMRGLLRYLRD